MAPTATPSDGPDPRVRLTDDEVVARVRDGETELFELLMRRYNGRVYRAVRGILRRAEDVEDAMQQAWLAAFTHLHRFEGRSLVSTWIVRIAVNEALGRLRRAKKLVLLDDPSEEETDMAAFPKSELNPERQAASREMVRALEDALDALPSMYRVVFLLRESEGMSTAETAEVLEVSQDVVKTRLSRARQMLRGELTETLGRAAVDAHLFAGARCDRLVELVMRGR